MKSPETRIPGNSHTNPDFLAIEEQFWIHKPKSISTYSEKHAQSFQESYKKAPQLDTNTAEQIWNFDVNEVLIPASYITHLSLFSIPSFIDALDARGGDGKPHFNYQESSVGGFSQHVQNFWVGISFATEKRSQAEHFRSSLRSFHGGTRSFLHFHPEAQSEYEIVDIPQSMMAMSVYETIRISEQLANTRNHAVSEENLIQNYHYFREILMDADMDAGIWMPENRADMEQIATQLDNMVKLTPATLELIERTIRIALLPHRETIDHKTISRMLRPNAQKLFSLVCQQYNYYT